MVENSKLVVAIAGASGYIGQHLLKKLQDKVTLIGLSRHGGQQQDTTHTKWRSCDLFSLADAEKGLEGADIAVYLVHSMMPSAKLTQGKFENMNIILADNFAQAAKRQNVKEVIYLGGIIPDKANELSRQLKSQLEIERILRFYGTPVTTLRAGLIVGSKGSSFSILTTLVKRLPVMLFPKWTRTKTQPIALADVVNSLSSVILDKEAENRCIDIGGPEVMTFQSMMQETAAILGKERKMMHVPFFSLPISRLWLRLITQTPKGIAFPLVETLRQEMIVQSSHYNAGISNGKITFQEAAQHAIQTDDALNNQIPKRKSLSLKQDVRSVQRVELPAGAIADWMGKYYLYWLEKTLNPWISTETDKELNCKISFMGKITLLQLNYSKERSTTDRALYYITDGLLTNQSKNERGRMEFRKIPGANEVIIGIHDFTPALPWFIYYFTQANVHLFMMYLFRKHMERISKHDINLEILYD